jgi:hypothetical protein
MRPFPKIRPFTAHLLAGLKQYMVFHLARFLVTIATARKGVSERKSRA